MDGFRKRPHIGESSRWLATQDRDIFKLVKIIVIYDDNEDEEEATEQLVFQEKQIGWWFMLLMMMIMRKLPSNMLFNENQSS